MRIMLVGNANCGKTTLFNRLTGNHSHTGNYPGVTVEIKSGRLLENSDIEICDLPGTVSLSPRSDDEREAVSFLRANLPDVIVNVMDISSAERSLLLTLELLSLDVPVIVVLNMADEFFTAGGRVDESRLGNALSSSVVPISAAKGDGVDRLIGIIESYPDYANRPNRLAASLKTTTAKYRYIDNLFARCFYPPRCTRAHSRSVKLDRLLLGKYSGVPMLIGIFVLIFWLGFDLIGGRLGEVLQDLVGRGADGLVGLAISYGGSPILLDLVENGIVGGIKTVVGFLPLMLSLSFFLSLLEDSGYLARAVFILDKPLSKIGLSGKSFVPLLLGFGCSVPAIMATRTLPSKAYRIKTALLVPFMSCGAKIPIYAAVASACFPNVSVSIICSLYLVGAIVAAVISSSVEIKEDSLFSMDLPDYRMPRLGSVFHMMWGRISDFLRKAFGVILLCSVAVWFLSRFTAECVYTADMEESMLAAAAKVIAPIFAPLGLGDWRITAALITGLTAKETVLSTLAIVSGGDIGSVIGGVGAYAFLLFVLLYPPCVSALVALRRELGRRYVTVALVGQIAAAYLTVLFVVRPIVGFAVLLFVTLLLAIAKKR